MSGPTRRVALIGYGLAGRVFHAPLVDATPGLELSMIVTSDPDRSAAGRREHPAAEVVGGPDEVFAATRRGELDLVVVASPNASHLPLGLRAVEAGAAVVVDKPLAPSADGARRLLEAARGAGVLLTVFQNRRFDGDYLTVRRLLDEGRLGRVHRFESRFERFVPTVRAGSWRERPEPGEAGGLLFDLGSHLVDQAVELFGPVRRVYAELDSHRAGSAVDDDVFVALTHTGGVHSHLWASAVAARTGPRFRLLGDRAAYDLDGLDPQERQLAAGLRPGDSNWGLGGPEHDGRLGAGDEVDPVPTLPGAYERFYLELAGALATGGPPPVDPSGAVSVLELLEAARRSAAMHEVVEIDVPGGAGDPAG